MLLQANFPELDDIISVSLEELESLQFANLPENRSTSGDTYYLQLPVYYGDDWENLDLFFHSEGGGQQRLDKENASIRISLDSRYLGRLSALVEIRSGFLNIHLYCEREETVEFIQPHLAELENALTELNFNLRGISVSPMIAEEDIGQYSFAGDESFNMIL